VLSHGSEKTSPRIALEDERVVPGRVAHDSSAAVVCEITSATVGVDDAGDATSSVVGISYGAAVEGGLRHDATRLITLECVHLAERVNDAQHALLLGAFDRPASTIRTGHCRQPVQTRIGESSRAPQRIHDPRDVPGGIVCVFEPRSVRVGEGDPLPQDVV